MGVVVTMWVWSMGVVVRMSEFFLDPPLASKNHKNVDHNVVYKYAK